MKNHSGWLIFALVLAGVALFLTGCAGGALPPTSWGGLTVDNGVAYMAATNRAVAVYMTSGALRWTFSFSAPQTSLFGTTMRVVPTHAQPAVDGTRIFIGTDGQTHSEGHVIALDAETGQVQWSFASNSRAPAENPLGEFLQRIFPPEGMGNIFAGLVVSDGIVYAAAADHLYALDTGTGRQVWHVALDGRIWATPLLTDGRLYVSTLNHKLFALDTARQGQVVWTFADARGALVGSPVLDADTLYIGSFDNRLYAIDARTGQQRWSQNCNTWAAGITNNWVWDGLTVVSDTLYVGGLAGYVQALDVATGQPRWPQPVRVEGAVRANPLPVGDMLAVATDAGNLYLLDAGTGQIRAIANAPLGRLLTPPLFDAGRRMASHDWMDGGARRLVQPLPDSGAVLIATLSGPVQLYSVDIALLLDAYEKQGRTPVLLYKEKQVNANIVRWYVPALYQ